MRYADDMSTRKQTAIEPHDLARKIALLAEEKKAADILVRSAGVELLVDPKSALYLRGTQLDYSDKMIGGGFKFSNPNAKASCSCGESFAV